MAIVPMAEEVILCQFRWQTEGTHLVAPIQDVPLVVMANMERSPVASSIDLLVKGLLHEVVAKNDFTISCSRAFLHLHKGTCVQMFATCDVSFDVVVSTVINLLFALLFAYINIYQYVLF